MPALVRDGRELFYEVAGDGPAVVLVHAGIADMSQWDAQVEALRDRFRVVRYDVAGFGRSPLAPGAFSHVRDLHALLEHLGVGRATLVGNSNGARIALEYALAHPERVDALVLVAGGLSDHDWSPEMQRADAEEVELFDAGELEAAADGQVRFWLVGPRREPDAVDPALRDRVHRMTLRSYELYGEAERAGEPPVAEWPDPPADERLADVRVPTLVVVGEHDVRDIFEMAERLEAGIPVARTAVVRDAAHLPSLERPDELNRLLLEFLSAR
ncbi:MAG: alpha/beta hydrolase [Actinomycetota bacterium]|nr:alpha/beta hydrolase [Actinomycetota bacterium]